MMRHVRRAPGCYGGVLDGALILLGQKVLNATTQWPHGKNHAALCVDFTVFCALAN